MTPLRAAAALAAVITAMLLQATVLSPAFPGAPLSLVAVLVGVVALREGASTGISLGFTAGLLTDLATTHPAGVLALSWLGIGLVCGMAVDAGRGVPARAAVAGVVCGATTLVTSLLLALTGAGQDPGYVLTRAPFAALGDAVLAAVLVPLTAVFLRSPALRRPHDLAAPAVVPHRVSAAARGTDAGAARG